MAGRPTGRRTIPLNAVQRDGLTSIATERTYAAGDTLFEPGEPATGAFVLLEGEVALSHPDRPEADATLSVSGVLFSRGSLLDAFEHRHLCVAVGAVRALHVPRDAFIESVRRNDAFALSLLDHLVRTTGDEVRALNQAIHDVVSER